MRYKFSHHSKKRLNDRSIPRKKVLKAIENHVARIVEGDTIKYIGKNGVEVVVNDNIIVTIIENGSASEKIRKKEQLKKEAKFIRKNRGVLGTLKELESC